MNVSSRQPLIRISKNGEMILKNKVGVAILKENAYEDRALNSQIVALKKHQARLDKYMTYRQLEFATKQIIASEERPHIIATTMTQNDSALPPIHSLNLNDSLRRRTNTQVTSDVNKNQDSSELKPPQRSKGTWEKAMTLVRVAVQNKQRHEATEQNKTFITQQTQIGKRRKRRKGMNELESTTLPPLTTSHSDNTTRYSRHRRGKLSSRQLSFHEMLKVSREKSKAGLHDPRFLKLESCLGEGLNVRSTRDTITTNLSSENEQRAKTDSMS
jgi:hypothetical protein